MNVRASLKFAVLAHEPGKAPEAFFFDQIVESTRIIFGSRLGGLAEVIGAWSA
jgi:hypothetical protein